MGHKHKKHHRDHDSDGEGRKHKKHHRDRESDGEDEHKHKTKKVEEVAQMLGYTNDTNPFQDSNLLQPFVWGKKSEKDKYDGKKKESSGDDKRIHLMGEIEKARKRRSDRENELVELEKLRDDEMRLREAASYGDWQKKEEDFHVEQVRQRSKLRLMNSREKPIDTIARNILIVEAVKDISKLTKQDRNILELDVEVRNPVELVTELELDELNQLIDDVDGYVQLESGDVKTYLKFWKCMECIVKRSINLKKGNIDLHSAVTREVEDLFAAKSEKDLELLVEDITRKAREESRDSSYWKTLSGEAQFQQAKRFVEKVHEDLVTHQLQEYRQMREELNRERQQNNASSSGAGGSSSSSNRGGVEGELEDDENNMAASDEVQLSNQNYSWQDKYRPRKPRYFNRVKTGYDWNKYNQTHYDVDNPPPLTVQGYKFTLFYPDLVDVTKTPRYFMERCGDTNEFVIIRFHAGPPYEDVAFKIVNKEWDVHRKSGYLSVFERGVLQLNFNFKRIFYRR